MPAALVVLLFCSASFCMENRTQALTGIVAPGRSHVNSHEWTAQKVPCLQACHKLANQVEACKQAVDIGLIGQHDPTIIL